MVQNKVEEISIHEKKLLAEGDSYKSSSWKDFQFKRALSFLFSFLDKNKLYNVLEIGSGGATLTKNLLKYPNLNTIGLDIVYEILDKITSKRTSVKLINGDIESLPFKNNCFDIVIHNQTLHHFPSRIGCLKEIYRVLKLNGFLMSIETNGLNPYVVYGHKAPWKIKKRYISLNQKVFSILKFKKELKICNFRVLGAKLINHMPFNVEFLEKILQHLPFIRLFSAGSMVICSQKN